LHAVRRALQALDREEPTRILDVVGELWGTKTIEELVNLGDSTPGPDFAAVAPAISQLAEDGDAVAIGVLGQAATDLVESVLLVRKKLRRKHTLAGEVPVAWIGSVIGKSRLVREQFFAGLHRGAPEMPVRETEVAGIEGAVWRAQQLANH
jgi:N-acetylglucosamine kinase-like BadF-type ATPase